MKFAVLGAGPAGLFSAHALLKAGHQVSLFEKHSKPGGSASFFRRKIPEGNLSFDAGATVLNAFSAGEYINKLTTSYGVSLPEFHKNQEVFFRVAEQRFALDVRSPEAFIASLQRAFPADATIIAKYFGSAIPRAQAFKKILEKIPHLPVENISDLQRNLKVLPALLPHLGYLLRHHHKSFADVMNDWGFSAEFKAWVNMQFFITLQCQAPNAHPLWGDLALCFYLFDSGAMRGGMRSLFEALLEKFKTHPQADLHMREAALEIKEQKDGLCIQSAQKLYGPYDFVVSSLPRYNTAALYHANKLFDVRSDYASLKEKLWGAMVAYVGVKDHPSLPDAPFNFHSAPRPGRDEAYISFSARNDAVRAPVGFRTVTLSAHSELDEWQDFTQTLAMLHKEIYELKKQAHGVKLLQHLREAYPQVEIVFTDYGSPKTFHRYTLRQEGAVGGIPLSRDYVLQNSLGQRSAHPRIFQVGDTSFPGQSVYACAIGAQALLEKLA